MTTLRRFIYRIAIPFIVVALIAAAIRFAMVKEFVDKRVTTVDPNSRVSEGQLPPAPFSDKNRTSLVEQLESSKAALDRSLAASGATPDDAERAEAQRLGEELERSIEELRSASEADWETRRQEALAHLKEYGQQVAAVR